MHAAFIKAAFTVVVRSSWMSMGCFMLLSVCLCVQMVARGSRYLITPILLLLFVAAVT